MAAFDNINDNQNRQTLFQSTLLVFEMVLKQNDLLITKYKPISIPSPRFSNKFKIFALLKTDIRILTIFSIVY
jgi:hypothetical protein